MILASIQILIKMPKIEECRGNMRNNILDYIENRTDVDINKIAFASEIHSLTFGELYDEVSKVGTYLLKNGQYRKPIIVFMEKEPRTIAAFLGVVSASCFYVPIDAEMPQNRMQLILDNVKPEFIICDDCTFESAKAFSTDGNIVKYKDMLNMEIDRVLLDETKARAIDTDPIYIVFTSGSTGVPKGVVGNHRATIDYIEQLSEIMNFNKDTIFGNQTPLYLDACFKEIFPTLKFGATTYLIPKVLFIQPVALIEFLNKYKINTVCWVVSAFKMITTFKAFDTVVPKYLHTVAFGSEVFPIDQFNEWKKVLDDATFTNLYGPTECTGMSCYYRVDREFGVGDVIPIGKAFKNTEVLLINDGKLIEGGEQGEICIRGSALTSGYYNSDKKTSESFVQNPLNTSYPELIYKTGDLGRYNERGELLFVSRIDFQVKHMGHRIELGEIEVAANMIEGVDNVACIYDKDKNKIVLFYQGEIAVKEIKVTIKDKLPRYMVPNVLKKVDLIPLTPNGKIDRVTLIKVYKDK